MKKTFLLENKCFLRYNLCRFNKPKNWIGLIVLSFIDRNMESAACFLLLKRMFFCVLKYRLPHFPRGLKKTISSLCFKAGVYNA